MNGVPDGTVLTGYALDDSTARFTVLPDGQPANASTTPHLSDAPCTPEAAAVWK